MKITPILVITIFLLSWLLGCKKEPELVPNLDSCRIVKQIYKNTWLKGSKIDTEPIIVEGRPVNVSTNTVTKFAYDKAGKLILETVDYSIGSTVKQTYMYFFDLIIKSTSSTSFQDNRSEAKDTLFLNKQGLSINAHSGLTATYDEQNFLIKESAGTLDIKKYIIQRDNLISLDYTNPNSDISHKQDIYEYLLDKNNLPNNQPFWGSASKNLVTRYTETVLSSETYPIGPVYQIEYTYIFDKYGRVKRRISIGKQLNPLWPFEADPYGIGVTDFEYECP